MTRRFAPLLPAPRLMWLAGAVVAAGVAAALVPAPAQAWAGVVAAIALAAVADATAALRGSTLAAVRRVPGSLPLGVRHEVLVRFANEGRRPVTLDAFDHHPPGMEAEGLPQRIVVPALANNFVGMMKDVTLVSIIGLSEFMQTARTVVSRTFRPFEIYTFVAAVYFVITIIFSRLISRSERLKTAH